MSLITKVWLDLRLNVLTDDVWRNKIDLKKEDKRFLHGEDKRIQKPVVAHQVQVNVERDKVDFDSKRVIKMQVANLQ